MIVGVDLDGVLFDYIGALLQYLKDTFGIIMRHGDVKTRDLAQFTDNREANLALIALFNPMHLQCGKAQEFTQNVKPFPYALDAVRILASMGTLVGFTRRSLRVRTATTIGLKTYFGDLITTVSFKENKVLSAHKYGCKYFFEDDPDLAMKIARKGIIVYAIGAGPGRYTSNFYRPTENVLTGAVHMYNALVRR